MAAYERVLVEINDHIGTLTLNRPDKLNAFDPDACEDLLEALRMLAAADAVRVIVITGAGRAFCAGADLAVLGTQGEQLRPGAAERVTERNAATVDVHLFRIELQLTDAGDRLCRERFV